ncbi:MAG: GTPase HflX [Ruminococcaceae bacterium]|nr:GTPase HflX [Oscillospiraceae bacterium]
MAEQQEQKQMRDKAALVGLVWGGETQESVDRSLDELAGLLDTAGGEAVVRMTQSKEAPDARTMIGSGKAAELAYLCACNGVTLVVFDCELSPSQIRNLEDIMGDGVRVIDRSMLILDIFALHAVTGEGKLQVELAQLKYTAPRLVGHGTELSRLGGGIGTRGPGESKLETDRRHMMRRMRALEEQIAEMDKNRKTMRNARDRSGIPEVAIVGYTNAGKSTLLNRLTDAGILAEDKLFATLDPTTRKFILPCGEPILLTDTVGFINKLPHHLIRAFRSTLEEACRADILLVLTDASDPNFREQLQVTETLLSELGAGGKPTLYVFNKCDKGMAETGRIGSAAVSENIVYISARTGQGVDGMIARLETLASAGKRRVTYRIPNSDGGALNTLYRVAAVESVEYGAESMTVVAMADAKARGMMRRYAVDDVLETEEEEY